MSSLRLTAADMVFERACEAAFTVRTLRVLPLIAAASLPVAAALDAGLVIPGPFEQAAIYEGSLGVILAIGLGLVVAWRVRVS